MFFKQFYYAFLMFSYNVACIWAFLIRDVSTITHWKWQCWIEIDEKSKLKRRRELNWRSRRYFFRNCSRFKKDIIDSSLKSCKKIIRITFFFFRFTLILVILQSLNFSFIVNICSSIVAFAKMNANWCISRIVLSSCSKIEYLTYWKENDWNFCEKWDKVKLNNEKRYESFIKLSTLNR